MKKNYYVLIEGMPGAGKTSVISLIKSIEDGFHVQDETYFDEATLPENYVETEVKYLEDSASKSKTISANQINLSDRGFISVLAYCYALESVDSSKKGLYEILYNRCRDMITEGTLILPDILIVLMIDAQISKRRRDNYKHNEEYKMWFKDDFLNAFYKFYNEKKFLSLYNGPILTLDTTEKEITQVAEFLIKQINESNI